MTLNPWFGMFLWAMEGALFYAVGAYLTRNRKDNPLLMWALMLAGGPIIWAAFFLTMFVAWKSRPHRKPQREEDILERTHRLLSYMLTDYEDPAGATVMTEAQERHARLIIADIETRIPTLSLKPNDKASAK